jgi:hypothetical protein
MTAEGHPRRVVMRGPIFIDPPENATAPENRLQLVVPLTCSRESNVSVGTDSEAEGALAVDARRHELPASPAAEAGGDGDGVSRRTAAGAGAGSGDAGGVRAQPAHSIAEIANKKRIRMPLILTRSSVVG